MGRVNEELAGFQWPPAARVVSYCPLSSCSWQHEDPPLPDGSGQTTDEIVADIMTKHFTALEEIVKAHLETHSLLEWVQEVRRLSDAREGLRAEVRRLGDENRKMRREAEDAARTAAVLVRKLGGRAEVGDADLAGGHWTLVREPTAFGFTLELHP